jgi:hypothetical protein
MDGMQGVRALLDQWPELRGHLELALLPDDCIQKAEMGNMGKRWFEFKT